MSKQILVNSSPYETRVATLEDGEIKSLHIEREEDRNVVGNIYKGLVKRVLPGMQAAFLELGLERTAFLYVDDIIDEPFGTEFDYGDEGDDEGGDLEGDSDSDLDGDLDDEDDLDAEDGPDDSEGPEPAEGAPAEAAPAPPTEGQPQLQAAAPAVVEAAQPAPDSAQPKQEGPNDDFYPEDEDDNRGNRHPGAHDDRRDVQGGRNGNGGQGSERRDDRDRNRDRDRNFGGGGRHRDRTRDNRGGDRNRHAHHRDDRDRNRNQGGRQDDRNRDRDRNRDQGGRFDDRNRDRNPEARFDDRNRDPRDNRDQSDPRDSRDQRDMRDPRDNRDRDPRDQRDNRDPRDQRDQRDNRDFRDNRDAQRPPQEGGPDLPPDQQVQGAPEAQTLGQRPPEGQMEPRPERNQDDLDFIREARRSNAEQNDDFYPEQPRDNQRDPRDQRDHRDQRDNRGGQGRDPRDQREGRDQRRDQGRGDRNDRGGDRHAGGRGDRGRRHGRGGPSRAHRRGGRGGGGGGRARRRERRNVEIQDLLKEGQELLVQVAKAPIGTKGARLTTHISLPGRNLVLMPTVKHLGISRRIESDRERRRLREIFTKRIRTNGEVGFIIRTVAEGKSYRELKADADYLLNLWDQIQDRTKKKKAPALIHEDLGLALKTMRDDFTDDVDSLVIDNQQDYDSVLDFISQFSPRMKGKVKLFRGPSQLFEHYGIEAEISRALGKKVWLKSGGYLLIDQSEALTAIDVNTGRYVGSKSLEETILKTNLEAVKEISYQLRIRNVGGIIIIDLIDMENAQNRKKVYDALQEALSEDKAKTNILKISELGLVEMTRKRTHEDLVRYLTEQCSYCEGRGYHKSRRTICFEIFREIEKEAIATTHKNIVVFANSEVVGRITKEEKTHWKGLEERLQRQIVVKPDPAFHVEQFEVFSKP